MSIANVTMAFQNAAITGEGLIQFFLEPRFTTFRITGNGSVSAGAVTIECCPGNTPMIAVTPLLFPPSKEVLSAHLCEAPKNPPNALW